MSKPGLRGSVCVIQKEILSGNMKKVTLLWNALKRYWKLRYGPVHFRLMDINCLAYLGLVGFLLIFFHRAVAYWPIYILIHAVLVIFILEIVRFGEKYPQKKTFWILRTFYPVALILYLWSELNGLVPMFYGSYWATDIIIHWDKIIFGVHPTVWVQQLYQPWLDELMNFFYTGYYTFFLLVPLSLFICKKKKEAIAVFSLTTFAYFSNFLLFYFFPVVSPRMYPSLEALHIKQHSGYFFSLVNRIVQAEGSVLGAAFPSSHVSGALVWALAALRYSRKLGYVVAPIALGVAVAAVYLGLHHAVDSIFGILWGFICYPIALSLIKKRGEDPPT